MESSEAVANCDHLAKLKFSKTLPYAFTEHGAFSRNTRLQLRQVLDALRELMVPPDPPRRPIGFVPPEDKDEPQSPKARRKT